MTLLLYCLVYIQQLKLTGAVALYAQQHAPQHDSIIRNTLAASFHGVDYSSQPHGVENRVNFVSAPRVIHFCQPNGLQVEMKTRQPHRHQSYRIESHVIFVSAPEVYDSVIFRG